MLSNDFFPPRLELGEFVLRPLRRDDAMAWFAYLSDPEVTRLTSYDIRAVDDVLGMIDWYLDGYAERRLCRWALARADSDVLVGTCGFFRWDQARAVAEIGYDLSRDHWNKGLMTRAVEASVDWGFNVLGANRIEATVMVGNIASRRVLEKCGFQLEDTLPQYKLCRGEPRDFWMLARGK